MKELKCGLGGEWSGKPLVCRFVDCGPPQIIENGQASLVNGSTTHGSIVEYTCEQDYWLQPHTSRRQICTKEAKWSADPPTCQREYTIQIIYNNNLLLTARVVFMLKKKKIINILRFFRTNSDHVPGARSACRRLRSRLRLQYPLEHRIPLRPRAQIDWHDHVAVQQQRRMECDTAGMSM